MLTILDPFRIMYANAQGAAEFEMSIVDPNGNVVLDAHIPSSSQVVQFSCDGISAPMYPPFGSET